jgi:hypothetical protein
LDVGYQVPITWRVDEPDLINNQEMATNQWRSLLRRFDLDPYFEKDYRAAMTKTFEQGYAFVLQDHLMPNIFLPITAFIKNRSFVGCSTPLPLFVENA